MNPTPTGGATGNGGQPRTSAILPPDIFDPRINGADAYWYVIDACAAGNLAAGGNSNPTLQIDAGTDFYLIALSYQAQVNAAGGLEESTNPIPLVTVQLNDSGSQRNLLSTAAPIGAIAGDGKRPLRLIRPRIFRAVSTLSFTFTSLEPSVIYSHLYLVLHGYRKFTGS